MTKKIFFHEMTISDVAREADNRYNVTYLISMQMTCSWPRIDSITIANWTRSILSDFKFKTVNWSLGQV